MSDETKKLRDELFNRPLSFSDKKEVSDLLEQLKSGVSSLMNSNRYKTYLDFISSFYHYSFCNVLLILAQKPDATKVGSFTFWKQHNRFVKKGEHGMKIIAPICSRITREVEVKNENGEIKRDKQGNIEKETKTITKINGFRFATVFDLSQTDGTEIPNILSKLTENTPISHTLIDTITEISNLPIKYEEIKANGYMDKEKIVVKSGMSLDQTAKTLIHEYTHSLFHAEVEDYHENRSSYEIEAESTAYVVCKHFGLDTSDYSFGYVTGWAKNNPLEQYEDSLKKIHDMSTIIIEKIENNLENEYEKIINKEKDSIRAQLKKAKVHSSPSLVENIQKLNHITKKNCTLQEIKQFSKKSDKSGEIAKEICNEINSQKNIKKALPIAEP